jgi:putative ribosome biogenesis GTPase RsgA
VSEEILLGLNKVELANTFQEENRTPIARLLQSVNLSWTDRALLVANTANGEQKTVINELLRDHYVQHCGGSGVGWSVLSSILLSWLITNLILLFRGNPSNESEIPTYIGDIDAKDIW